MVAVVLATLLLLSQAQTPRDAARAAPMTGTGTISGVVLTGDGQDKPVRRARVSIFDPERRNGATVVSDDAGRFVFTNVAPGRYTVTPYKNAWVGTAYGAMRPGRPGTPVTIQDGQRIDEIALRMVRGAVITGTLTDQHGLPLARTSVMPFRYVFQNGTRTLVPSAGGSLSDDRGVYRIYGLQPGQYVVGASPRNSPLAGPFAVDLRQTTDADIARALTGRGKPGAAQSSQPNEDERPTVNYASVFYPGTTSSGQATMITVSAGEERGGIDFPVTVVATARIEGNVIGSDGTIAANSAVNVISSEPGVPGFGFESFRTTTTSPEGRFTLQGLPPGRYTVMSRATAPGEAAPKPRAGGPLDFTTPSLWAMAEVVLDGHPVSGITLMLQPGFSLSGRVQFSGSLPAPDLSRLRINLNAVTAPGQVAIGVPATPVHPDGTFTITGIVPGTYRLSATIPGARPDEPGWTIASAVAGGQDTLDLPLQLRENVADAVLTFTDRAGELAGALQDPSGRPVRDYYMILFSADRTFWTPQSRRIRAVRPSAEGKYLFRQVPRGEYLMAAVADIEDGEWFDPVVLERLSAGAMQIAIAEGEKKTQDIQVGR